MTIIVFLLLVIGLVYPTLAIVFGCIHFVARWIYVIGYKSSPNMRLLGGLPINLSNMAMCVMGIVAASAWISQIPKV